MLLDLSLKLLLGRLVGRFFSWRSLLLNARLSHLRLVHLFFDLCNEVAVITEDLSELRLELLVNLPQIELHIINDPLLR